MEVTGVSLQITPVIQTETLHQTNPAVEEIPQEQPQGGEIPEPEATEQSEDGQVKGVICNLLNGHYKGVADLRLRINNFDALQAIEQEQLQAVIEENDGHLESIGQSLAELLKYTEEPTAPQETPTNIVSANVEEATASDGLTKEQKGTAVDASKKVNELLNSEGQSKDTLLTLVTGLKSTLMVLSDSLNSAVSATTNETPQTPVVSADDDTLEIVGADAINGEDGEGKSDTPPVDSPSDFENLVSAFSEDLNSFFLAALDELTNSLSEVGVLPELSEPSGNGVAYENFLAIYNQMQIVETAEDDTAGNEEVDTVA